MHAMQDSIVDAEYRGKLYRTQVCMSLTANPATVCTGLRFFVVSTTLGFQVPHQVAAIAVRYTIFSEITAG